MINFFQLLLRLQVLYKNVIIYVAKFYLIRDTKNSISVSKKITQFTCYNIMRVNVAIVINNVTIIIGNICT